MADKEISIILRAKNAMQAGISGAVESMKKFGTGVVNVTKQVTKYIIALGATIGGMGAYFVKAASDAQETGTKFDAVFSSIQNKANQMADALAADFGLAGSSARKMLGDTGDLLVGFGFTEEGALDLADQVGRLAVDLASFTNYSGGASGASQALTKALLGETESAKGLGIVIRQNSQEFRDSVAAVMAVKGITEQQAKAMVILDIAMQQTTKAQGDYARTQDGLANRARLVKERFKEFREEIGGIIARSVGLNNVMKIVADRISDVTKRVMEWAQNGGIDKVIAGLKSAFERIKAIMELRYEAALILITGATAAAAIKVALLAKNSAVLSMEINKATISLAAKAVATKAAGVASAGAAIKVLALKTAVMALSAVPWLALAAGFIAVGKATLDMVKATHQLETSMKNLQAIEQQSLDTWGIRSPAALRKFREAMNSGDQAMIDNMEKTHPKAVAKWRELHGTVDKATESMDENTAANGEQKESIADLVAEQEKQQKATEEAAEAARIAAEAQKEYIAEVTDAVKTAMDARKDAAEKLAGELDDLEKQQADAVKDAEEAKRKEAEKTLAENQRLAKLRVGDVIAMAEEEKRIAKEVAEEDRRMSELQERVRRGARLGRKQAEELAAWERIQAAKKAVEDQNQIEKDAAEHEANEKIRIEKERQMRIDEIRAELGEDAKELGDDEIQNALDVKRREEQIVKDRVAAFIDGNKERARVDAANADEVIENMEGVASARDHLFPESISGSVGDDIGGAISAGEAFKNAQLNKLDEVIDEVSKQTQMLRELLVMG